MKQKHVGQQTRRRELNSRTEEALAGTKSGGTANEGLRRVKEINAFGGDDHPEDGRGASVGGRAGKE